MAIPRRDDVQYLGAVSDAEVGEWMSRALAVVMPSAQESLSMATLEAMASGCPVIVYRSSPVLVAHLEQSEAGFLYANHTEWSQAVDTLRASPSLIRKLGERGQRYIQEHYGKERVLRSLVAEIEAATHEV